MRLVERTELERFKHLLDEHHYLGSLKAVGQRLHYVATDARGQWLALLVFSAPAKHLKHRDRWIGWSAAQRHRRLSLVTNNSRFLILPERSVPNLASKVLRLTLDRLPTDWQTCYGHPVLVVETFVDAAQFCGTVYSASGWSELGQTDGWGRHRRDYYVKHDQPKRLFCRQLCKNARRSLQAEHLKPALAVVEQQVSPPCTRTVKEIRSMVEHFKAVPDFRVRFESYPLWSMLTILLLATLCGAPRGQKDLAQFARGLSQAQRRALGIRPNAQGKYPAPTQPTFCRLLQRVDAAKVEEVILALQEQVRGPAPQDHLIVLDGKEPKHGSGASILSAVTVPSQHYLGSAVVDQKTNEIPVARELFKRLELEERFVSLDALHTQEETARALVLDHGADYLLTVKGNQPTVRQQIETLVAAPQGDFPPS
ncbi:MAG: ISAs1 family transposase [Acetobacteraceae bacterium]|nr:ISAs1 family transposase [Acetobacteraceae bacterium]